MCPHSKRRVYVGVDGSIGSLRALRQAADEARHRRADLYAVYVVPPVRAGVPRTNILDPVAPPQPGSLPWIDQEAESLVSTSLEQALGGRPGDLTVQHRVLIGRPDKALSGLGWCDDDLLVVGASRHPRWRRVLRRSVSRYCATHARCPVLVVPPDRFAMAMLHRQHWLPSALRRHDLWKQFDAATSKDRQPTG